MLSQELALPPISVRYRQNWKSNLPLAGAPSAINRPW